MSYGYVYTAQVAMGADNNQVLKAMVEAESYDGPSLIIAYAPCINHGIKGGMGIAQLDKNPFQLDSKAPTASYRDFIMGEVRYNALTRKFPERAEKLFNEAEKYAEQKYAHLSRIASFEDAT